jgi:hypothetical protein
MVLQRLSGPGFVAQFSIVIHETGGAGADFTCPCDCCDGFEIIEIGLDDARLRGEVADGVKAPLDRRASEPMAKLPELVKPLIQIRHARFQYRRRVN